MSFIFVFDERILSCLEVSHKSLFVGRVVAVCLVTREVNDDLDYYALLPAERWNGAVSRKLWRLLHMVWNSIVFGNFKANSDTTVAVDTAPVQQCSNDLTCGLHDPRCLESRPSR